MDLRRARTIFRVTERIPIEDLNSSFRELVKKYHPDRVREHPEWAHERMSEVNDAYETLAEWINTPLSTKSATGFETQPTPKPQRPDENLDESRGEEDFFRREIPALSARMEKEFYPLFHDFLDGLGIYYQYGLENPANRTEGVRRFRYREAFRAVERSKRSLEKTAESFNHPVLRAVARFARLAAADIDLGQPYFSEGANTNRRFDDKLRSARRNFDGAVKEILFPELIPTHLKGRAIAGLYACYTTFVLYLTMFDSGERQKAGILQAARYDAFMELVELRSDGLLRF